MALTIHSCLKPSPPTPSSLPKTTLTPWSTNPEQSWRRRCFSTMACVIIGSTVVFTGSNGSVLAGDLGVAVESEGRVMRWSEKRRCPPWHVNSLENNVPENLPRPSAKRKSNSFASYQTAPAPAVGIQIQANNSCYSL